MAISPLLLDANVLIALTQVGHIHHRAADLWSAERRSLAVSPVTEGALMRFVVRSGGSAAAVQSLLDSLYRQERYVFWPDSLSYADAALDSVRGYKQVTDSYLVSLAASRGTVLATFDHALSHRYPGHTELVPRG
ncbi:PIN domain-containing protein [Brevibacterium album]|uniref:PIN domain-containing protein n=1 Tax=Brevibacterium album TaxID=417948 RepID=UPI00041AD9AC|nr:PIN domain-containing protein [Brevibacterium album]